MKLVAIRETTWFRTLVVAVGAALLTMLGLAITAPPASAYTLSGCQYDPDSIDPISYRFFSVDSKFETALKDGEAVWDATSAPGYFTEQSWSIDPEVNIIDEWHFDEYWATMTGQCDAPNYWWDGNEVEIEFNYYYVDSLSANQWKIVAEHELGHAYGLGDVQSGCHVMIQGEYKFTCGTVPSTDDVDGVEAIY